MLITEEFVTALRSAFHTFEIPETIRPVTDSAVIAGKTRVCAYLRGVGGEDYEFGIECARSGAMLAAIHSSLPLSAITAVVEYHRAYPLSAGVTETTDRRQLTLLD